MSELSIRNVTSSDLDIVSSIEAICFPPAEADPKYAMKERIEIYPQGFLVGEVKGEVAGFINGASTDSSSIEDHFFRSMDFHDEKAENLVIFGLDVHPNYQGRGYARKLMKAFIDFARTSGKSSVILTCKEHLIKYYESFGYENLGVSDSVYGGARWYDMKLNLK